MPIVTANACYIWPPKTGGHAVEAALSRRFGPEAIRTPGQHAPARSCTPQFLAGRRMWATVRSPWPWYYSVYRHALHWKGGRLKQLAAYGRGETDFRSVLYGMTHLDEGAPPYGWGVITMIHAGRDSFRGLASLASSWMWADESGRRLADLIPTECLAEGMAAHFGDPIEVERRETAEQRWGVTDSCRDAYDDDMIRWVEDADAPHLALFPWRPFEPLEYDGVLEF